MRATPYVDFVMQSHLLSTAEVTAALGVAPDDVVADSPYGSPSHRSPAAKGLLPTNEVPSWRFREDSGILFTGMDERTYVTRIQVSRLVKRLIPFQDPLAALNRRLGEEEGWLNHMYLELVVPWNDSLEIKYTSEVVDVEALNFLGAVGAMLVATFVDVADQLDEGPVTHAD
jgi:hypothetical protein